MLDIPDSIASFPSVEMPKWFEKGKGKTELFQKGVPAPQVRAPNGI
jgi:hypothetical protein